MRLLERSRSDWPSQTALMEHAPITLTVKAGQIIHAQLWESLECPLIHALATYTTGEYFTSEGNDGREPEVLWA